MHTGTIGEQKGENPYVTYMTVDGKSDSSNIAGAPKPRTSEKTYTATKYTSRIAITCSACFFHL